MSLGRDLEGVVTYDQRMSAAAETLVLATLTP